MEREEALGQVEVCCAGMHPCKFELTEKSNYTDNGMIQLKTDLTENIKTSSWRILRASSKSKGRSEYGLKFKGCNCKFADLKISGYIGAILHAWSQRVMFL